MNKSTQAISQILMGSVLALAGCSSGSDDAEDDRAAQGGHGYRGGVPVMIRGGGARPGGVTSAPSVRGGFGGTGGISSGS